MLAGLALRGLLCLAPLAYGAGAQPGGATGLDDPALPALRSLRAGDATRAARQLEELTRSGSAPGSLWRALGSAYEQLHEHRHAIVAYRQALELEPDQPQALYALGSAYAGARMWPEAWELLGQAHATGRVDMSQMSVDPNLAGVRKDARFAALLPRAQDFERPFVEPVHVIHEWRGEAAGDQFGWIARNIGDVDGDGVNDLVISAPTHGAHGGRIYVYSGRSGALLWQADGPRGVELGTGLEAAGDTNRDGTPDVIASGPAAAGIARVYGGRDGRVLREFHAERTDENFGNHASGAGDVDGDGYADLIVGSPGKDGEERSSGHAYVYSGRTGERLLTLSGERAGDQFGSTVAGYSDGRVKYLVVGAPRAGPARHGRVYVYAGAAHQLAFTIEADAGGDALGLMFVGIAGDVDGDGVPDIYASDWSNVAHGFGSGRVYVYSGRTGEPLLTLSGEHPGDGFGTSSSVAGDVDHDGRADLIVGAWQFGGAAVGGGAAYLYDGRTGRLLQRFTDRVPGDTLGFDAVGLGAAGAEGGSTLLLSAAWSAVHGHHSGRVFLVGAELPAAGTAAAR
jgi:hypothetical protein